MKLAHRAKKNLDELYGYEKLGTDKNASWARHLGESETEEVYGQYQNGPDCDTEVVTVTSRGIYITYKLGCRFLPYEDIKSVRAPGKDPKDRTILLYLKTGDKLPLLINGGKGRFKDAYGFHSFLRSAPGDQR